MKQKGLDNTILESAVAEGKQTRRTIGVGLLAAAMAATTAGCPSIPTEEKSITVVQYTPGALSRGNFEPLIDAEFQKVTGVTRTAGESIAKSLETMQRAAAIQIHAGNVAKQAERYNRMVGLAEALQGAVTVTADMTPANQEALLTTPWQIRGWMPSVVNNQNVDVTGLTGITTSATVQYFSELATNLGNIASMTIQTPASDQTNYQFAFTVKTGDKVTDTIVTSKVDTDGKLKVERVNIERRDAKDAKPLPLEIKRKADGTTIALDSASRTLYTTQSNATHTAVQELLDRFDISDTVVTGTAVEAFEGFNVDISKIQYWKDTPTTTAAIVIDDKVYTANVTKAAFDAVASALVQKHIAIEQHDVAALARLTKEKDHKGKFYATMDDVYEARKQLALKQNDFGELLALGDVEYSTKKKVMPDPELGAALHKYARSEQGQKFKVKAAFTYTVQKGRRTQWKGYGVVDPKKGGRMWNAEMGLETVADLYGNRVAAAVAHEARADIFYLRPSETGDAEEVMAKLNRRGEFGDFVAFDTAVKDGHKNGYKIFDMNGNPLHQTQDAAEGLDSQGKTTKLLSRGIIDALEKKEVHMQGYMQGGYQKK